MKPEIKTVDQMRAALVTRHNPARYELTEANAGNINPLAGVLTNANPAHDAAQRMHDQRMHGAQASCVARAEMVWPTYRTEEKFAPLAESAASRKCGYGATVRGLANAIAEKYIRRAKVSCAHLRAEFVCETESAIGVFLASRVSRFPTLARDLLARFACDALPNTTRRALHVSALKACDARTRHLAKNVLCESSYFDACDETNALGETTRRAIASEKLDAIRARCDELKRTLASKLALATNNKQRGQILAAGKTVDRANAWAIASVQSEAFAFVSPLSFHNETETVVQIVREGGRFCGKRTFQMSTGKILTQSALWKRARTLGRTLEVKLV